MSLWMVWAIAIGGLLGLAGHLFELVSRGAGRSGRWVWLAVIVFSLGLQARSLLPRPSDPAVDPSASGTIIGLPTDLWYQLMPTLGPLPLDRVDAAISIAWPIASLLLAIGLLGGALRLRRKARQWPAIRSDEHEVLVSDGFGPALIGLASPSIVLPRQVLDEHPESVPVICRHEAEHRVAGDHWILGLGALLSIAFPWNLALWWHLHRLRRAIEMDCDQRVLGGGVGRKQYARVLLSLGQRGGDPVHVPAFLHPPLERRLKMIVRGAKASRPSVRVAGAVVAAGLILVACEAGSPTLDTNETPTVSTGSPSPPAGQSGDLADGPLIIVDGEEVGVGAIDLEFLDPDLIESVEVIKGLAATEIYGIRASNGVVSITLKD